MKEIILLVLAFFLFPASLIASELDINIECPKTIKKNEEFTCHIKGVSDYQVSAIEYEFELPNNLTKLEFEVDPIWEGSEKDNLVLLYTDENKSGEFAIGTITLKAQKDNLKVGITTKWLLFGDDTFKDHIVINKRDVKGVESKGKKLIMRIIKLVVYVIIIVVIILLLYKVHKKHIVNII